MIELGLGAWFGVIMLQALFYGILSPSKRRKSHAEAELTKFPEKPVLGSIVEEEEYTDGDDSACAGGSSSRNEFQEDDDEGDGDETPLSLSPRLPAFGDRPIEEEPQEIRHLLNQTGSELVGVVHSMSFFERLAKEQLQQDEGPEETLDEPLDLPQAPLIGAY